MSSIPTDLPEPGSPYQTLISPMARRWCTSQTFLLLVLRSANSVPRRMRPLCCGGSSDACVPLSIQSGAWSTSALKPSGCRRRRTSRLHRPCRRGQAAPTGGCAPPCRRASGRLLAHARGRPCHGPGDITSAPARCSAKAGSHLRAPPGYRSRDARRASVRTSFSPSTTNSDVPASAPRSSRAGGTAPAARPRHSRPSHPSLVRWIVRSCPAPLAKGFGSRRQTWNSSVPDSSV